MPETAFPAGLFFTGTDTGVGKTTVAAAVACLLRQRGHEVAVRKPVATGGESRGGRLVSEDTIRLADAAGLGPDAWEQVTPWTFADPVAPPVAARRQGVGLSLEQLIDAVYGTVRPGEVLLVEGVGGLLCPLTENDTVADLAAALGLPLVVVARRSLGTLNHTLLTLEAARARRLPVAGVVVSETAPPDGPADATNVDELRRLGVPVLAVAPYRKGGTAEELARLLAEVDWGRLCRARVAPEEERALPCRR